MRSIREVANVGNLRSMNSIGARSIPKVQRSVYLDLYVLKREKERLEKEMLLLDNRRRVVKRLLKDAMGRIQKLQGEIEQEPGIKTAKQTKSKGLRTMSVRY